MKYKFKSIVSVGLENWWKVDIEVPLYDLATIVTATNHFSEANMIGKGGFGPVYMVKNVNYMKPSVEAHLNPEVNSKTCTICMTINRESFPPDRRLQ